MVAFYRRSVISFYTNLSRRRIKRNRVYCVSYFSSVLSDNLNILYVIKTVRSGYQPSRFTTMHQYKYTAPFYFKRLYAKRRSTNTRHFRNLRCKNLINNTLPLIQKEGRTKGSDLSSAPSKEATQRTFPLRPTLPIGSFRQNEPLVFCHYLLEVVIFGSLRPPSSEVAASDFRYRFVTVIRFGFGEKPKVHRHNVTCVTDSAPTSAHESRGCEIRKTQSTAKTKRAEEIGTRGCEPHGAARRRIKKTRRSGYINIHHGILTCRRCCRRCRSRDSLSLRLSEFIREFSLSQAVINAATTAGAETYRLSRRLLFGSPSSLTSIPLPFSTPFVEERVAHK